ncbi:MAG: GAF domain-containing protein [Anaerolineae bacterium]|nr:GAF domain-containing protein [Anaerolineae bacterium]
MVIGGLLWQQPTLSPMMLVQMGLFAVYLILVSLATWKGTGQQWIGFALVSAVLSWQIIGLALTLLWMLVSGIVLHLFAQSPRGQKLLQEYDPFLARTLLTAFAMIAFELVMRGVWQVLPSPEPSSILMGLVLIPPLVVLWLGMVLVEQRFIAPEQQGIVLTPDHLRRDRWLRLSQQFVLLVAAAAGTMIYSIIGDWVLYLGLSLIALQALQAWRSEEDQIALSQQVAEMTALDNLRQAITAQVTRENVLNVLREMLMTCLQFQHFMVLLYDDAEEMVEYALIVRQGKTEYWPPRRCVVPDASEDFPDGTLRVIQPANFGTLTKLGVPRDLLSDVPYVAAPLITGDILLGFMLFGGGTPPGGIQQRQLHLLERVAHQTALALRNASLYDRTTHIAQNLSIINQSVQDVMFNLNREEALKSACLIAVQVTNAPKCAIYAVQPGEDNLLVLEQSIGLEPYKDREGVRRIAPHPKGVAVMEANHPITEANLPLQQLTRSVHAVGCIQVPLRSGNMPIGKLIVFHDEPRLYSMLERSVLETLANQTSAAMDNSDLLQALERFATEQADLVHLSRISSEDLDLERIIKSICQVLQQMFLVDRVEIGIVEGDVLKIYAPTGDGAITHTDLPHDQVPEFAAVVDGNMLQPVQEYDRFQSSISREAQAFCMARGARSLITIGMHINHQSLGLVLLMDQQSRRLTENELHLLEMVTNQITGQIHNAHIYALTEHALVQRLQQLVLLEELTQQITQSTNLDLIIDTTLEAALQATQAEFAALALQDEHANVYKLIWQERTTASVRRGAAMASPEPGIVQQVAQTGEIRLIFDTSKAPGYRPPQVAELTYQSMLAVPLHEDDRVIGVLRVESIYLDHFTEGQVGFIRNLAEHAAISIEKARLLAQRQQRIQMLTLLRNLSMETLSATNPQHVAHIVLRTALQMLNGKVGLLYVVEGEKTPHLFSSLSLNQMDHEVVQQHVPPALLRRAIQESTTQMISDVQRSHYTANQTDIPFRSLIVVPVLRRGIVHELLCVVFEEVRSFGLLDLNAVDLLASQVAGHLENARLNEALHVSYDRMRAIINATQSAIILLDLDGIIQDANQVAEELIGTTTQDMLEQSVTEVLRRRQHDDESWQKFVTQYSTDPQEVQGQEFVFMMQEKLTDFKVHLYPVWDKNQELIGRLLVLRNITEEKDLQRFQHRIQRMIVHDLVGPLGAIITGLSFSQEVLEDPQESEDLATTILPTVEVSLDSAESLLHMVQTLRDLPKTTNMNVFPEIVEIEELVTKARDALSSFLVSDSIIFEYRPIGEIPPLYVDADLIRRVIINLLHNAFKFTPEGGTILIAVDHAPEQEGFLRVRVNDTGPGIPPAERQRIFQEYTQIEGRLPRAGGRGMGLGLHFCKLAVEAHGGTIWAADEGLLSGACIAFTLPTVSDDQQESQVTEEV